MNFGFGFQMFCYFGEVVTTLHLCNCLDSYGSKVHLGYNCSLILEILLLLYQLKLDNLIYIYEASV